MIRGQLQWRNVTLGYGTDIDIVSIKGLDSLPSFDNTSTLRPRGHGAIPGTSLAQPRYITVELEIVAGDTAETRKLLRDLTYATEDGTTEELRFLIDDDDEILLNAQLIKRDLDIDSEYIFVNTPAIQWLCPDPRRYGTAWTVDIPLPLAGAGQSYPFTYPKPYVTVAGESGARTIENTGSADTPWTSRIVGPVKIPTLTFTFPDGSISKVVIDLELASGEWLDVDVLYGTVLLNGSTDRFGALSGAILDELFLPPGITTLSWTAQSGTTAARWSLTGRNAEM